MSQEEKPIFPRSSEMSEDEKQELHRQTVAKLEGVEKTPERPFSDSDGKIYCPRCQGENPSGIFFCLTCGNTLNDSVMAVPSTVYGPPPMMVIPVTNITMYGPPPMDLSEPDENKQTLPGKSKTLWIVIAVALFVLLVVLVIIPLFVYYSLKHP